MSQEQVGNVARQMVNAPRREKVEKKGSNGNGNSPEGIAGKTIQDALREASTPQEMREMAIESSKAVAPGGLPGNPIAEMFDKITFELPNSNRRFEDEGNKNKSSMTGAFVSLHSALVEGFILKATIRIDYVKGMDEEGPYEDAMESFKWYSKSFGRDTAVCVDKGFPEVQVQMERFQEYVLDMYRNWKADIALKTAQKAGPVHVPKGFTRIRPPKEAAPTPAFPSNTAELGIARPHNYGVIK